MPDDVNHDMMLHALLFTKTLTVACSRDSGAQQAVNSCCFLIAMLYCRALVPSNNWPLGCTGPTEYSDIPDAVWLTVIIPCEGPPLHP